MRNSVVTESAAPPSVQPEAAPRLRIKPLLLPMGAFAVIAAGVGYIVTHDPHQAGGTFVCPLAAATGLYCPGCGGTRAVYDLAHGDIAGALSMNPLFTLAAPLILVLWMRWALRGQGVQLKEWPFPTWMGIALPAVIVAFTVMRNLPLFAPYLAP